VSFALQLVLFFAFRRGSTEITPDLSVFSEESSSSPVTTATTEAPITEQRIVVGAATSLSKDIGVDQARRSLLLTHAWLLGIGKSCFGVAKTALLQELECSELPRCVLNVWEGDGSSGRKCIIPCKCFPWSSSSLPRFWLSHIHK